MSEIRRLPGKVVSADEGASYDEASGARIVRVGRWSKRRIWVNPDAFNIEYTDEENHQAMRMGLN